MAEFSLKCQMIYPQRCGLQLTEREEFGKRLEKYKVFLMRPFKGGDTYLKSTIKEYLDSSIYFVYDSKDIRGGGVKFCKICKLAQACDFGIAVLSPENLNVFMEIGLLIGMGKPYLYVVHPSKLKCKDIRKLPFNISDRILVKYNTEKKLLRELAKEVPKFMIKVHSSSGCEKAERETIRQRIEKLTPVAKALLKTFVNYGRRQFKLKEIRSLIFPVIEGEQEEKEKARIALERLKFIRGDFPSYSADPHNKVYSLEEADRPILKELLFSD